MGLVTVYWHYEGPDDSPVWDTHWNNFKHLRERLAPPTDQALAALLDDLAARGLLDDTLADLHGRIRPLAENQRQGRPRPLAPRAVDPAGRCGNSRRHRFTANRTATEPIRPSSPIKPANLTATFLHLLGVPPDLEAHDRAGRPFRAYLGTPIPELIT